MDTFGSSHMLSSLCLQNTAMNFLDLAEFSGVNPRCTVDARFSDQLKEVIVSDIGKVCLEF